jgi:hypothetical protein
MYPNSRSPWAAWFRFMKSMSMVDHGSDSLACVCRCSSGARSASSPWIHIRAGENVCIHAITPTHVGSEFASSMVFSMPTESVSTGRHTTSTGPSCRSSDSAISRDWAATCLRVSSP